MRSAMGRTRPLLGCIAGVLVVALAAARSSEQDEAKRREELRIGLVREQAATDLSALLASSHRVWRRRPERPERLDKPARRPSAPLLALGVLTLPRLVRTPMQRSWHRAAHYSQDAVRDGVVSFRYVVSSAEVERLERADAQALAEENATYGDLLLVPAVPRGPLRRAVRDPERGPLGAGCVLKILSWLQHAREAMPRTPFVAYGDDDTFWALTRTTDTLRVLLPAEPLRRPMYIGAMQYHRYWDFKRMESHGWDWTLLAAAKGFAADYRADDALFDAPAAGPPAARLAASAARFARPYMMAHGLGVVLSAELAGAMPTAAAVADFLELYDTWLEQTPAGRAEQRKIAASHKCRLGTDSTFGAWVGALDVPIVAVDLLNFNMAWPWPLPNRCHGNRSQMELNNLHAFHLFGAVAGKPEFWMHLHNQTTLHQAPVPAGAGPPRLRCRHDPDASAPVRQALDQWIASGVAAARPESLGRFFLRSERKRLGDSVRVPDWLFCGITCVGENNCQREFPDLRRRRRSR